MTNAEKYHEVFGLTVNPSICPASECKFCPCSTYNRAGTYYCMDNQPYKWWNEKYKGAQNAYL